MSMKSWREMIRPAWEYYNNGNPCGGDLHIVLDDGNLEDDHIRWCLRLAEGHRPKWVEGLPGPGDSRIFAPGATGRWEEEFLPETRDEAAIALANLLLSASLTQRRRLYSNYRLYAIESQEPVAWAR